MGPDSLNDIFAQTAKEVNAPSDEALTKISNLAKRQQALEERVVELEERLKNSKKILAKVTMEELPDAMDEVGMSNFTLRDGTIVTIKRGFVGSITKKHEAGAHNWLKENGHGAIIKHVFSSRFGKDEDERSEKFAELLKENGYTYEEKENVHSQTLKAFVNEQMTQEQVEEIEGEETAVFPQELFGVFAYRVSKLG